MTKEEKKALREAERKAKAESELASSHDELPVQEKNILDDFINSDDTNEEQEKESDELPGEEPGESEEQSLAKPKKVSMKDLRNVPRKYWKYQTV